MWIRRRKVEMEMFMDKGTGREVFLTWREHPPEELIGEKRNGRVGVYRRSHLKTDV